MRDNSMVNVKKISTEFIYMDFHGNKDAALCRMYVSCEPVIVCTWCTKSNVEVYPIGYMGHHTWAIEKLLAIKTKNIMRRNDTNMQFYIVWASSFFEIVLVFCCFFSFFLFFCFFFHLISFFNAFQKSPFVKYPIYRCISR